MVDPPPRFPCSNKHDRGPARVVLAHDWLVARRGGELVLDAIARAVCSLGMPAEITRLYTMFDTRAPVLDAIDALPRTVSPLNVLHPGLRRWMLPGYPAAVAWLSRALAREHARAPIDLLISSSSSAIKSISAPPGVPHICYCHTPARYLWSQPDQYGIGGLKGIARGVGLGMFRHALREWDRSTSDRVSAFLANSSHTRTEIRTAYGRDARVVHPPVRTGFFTPGPDVHRDRSLLVVSALEPYKRVDLAIDAAAACGRRLDVIGTGSHEPMLRAHAARTPGADVEFLGQLDDACVRAAMRRAWAFLMPQVEDFGITSVEAQACGTPVVSRKAGGALDTVIHGRTGALVEGTSVSVWTEAIRSLDPDAMAVDCRENALRFSEGRFESSIRGVIEPELRGVRGQELP